MLCGGPPSLLDCGGVEYPDGFGHVAGWTFQAGSFRRPRSVLNSVRAALDGGGQRQRRVGMIARLAADDREYVGREARDGLDGIAEAGQPLLPRALVTG